MKLTIERQLIVSAYVLVTVLALLLGSNTAAANPDPEASLPGSPTGPEPVVTITAPAANSYNSGSVIVRWTVTPNHASEFPSIWNHTQLTNVSTTWQEPSILVNKSHAGSVTYSGLTEGRYVVSVFAVYWNGTAGAYQNSTVKTVYFTVDRTKPALSFLSPIPGSITNSSDFEVDWTVSVGTGSPLASVVGTLTNVTGGFTYPSRTVTYPDDPYWVTNLTISEPLGAGVWSLRMVVTDGAGNAASLWNNFTVAPFVVIDNPGEYIAWTDFVIDWTPHLIPGTSLANYEVSLYDDDSDSWFDDNQTVTVPRIQLHNVSNGAELSDATSYIVYVKVTDSNGDSSVASQPFKVDTGPPSVHWVAPTDEALSNDEGLAIQWSAEDIGSPIVRCELSLSDSTGRTGSLSIEEEGVNTITLSSVWGGPVPDEDYLLNVTAYDGGGNHAMDSIAITIDATAPPVDILAPVRGTYTQLTNFTASWAAIEDAHGPVYSWARVIDTTGVAREWMNVTGQTSQWIVNLTGGQPLYEEGTWQLAIAARDKAGNNATSVREFTVDRSAPEVEFMVPGDYVNRVNFTASWNGSDDHSPIDHYLVMLTNRTASFAGPFHIGNATSGWVTNWTIGHADLDAGDSYVLNVTAFDKAGNSASYHQAFSFDLVDPEVAVTFPVADGDGVPSRTVNVAWNGSDDLSGIASYNVSMDGDWFLLGDIGNYEFVNLSEGTHTFTVVAFDGAGGSRSATRSFIVDVTKPEVGITFPLADQIFGYGAIDVNWTMGDPYLERVEVRLDDGTFSSVGLNTSFHLTSLSNGAHTFSVRAIDIAGNYNETSVSFLVDRVGPVIAMLNPVDDGFYGMTNLTASWFAVDPVPTSGISHFEVKLDDRPWQNLGMNATLNLTGLAQGAHTFSVRAHDNASNNFTTSITFVIDLVRPVVSIIEPSGEAPIGSSSVTMNWTAFDAAGIASFEVMIDGGHWMPMAQALSYEIIGLADGDHTATVRAHDPAGNFNDSTIGFRVDATAPDVVISSPENGAAFAHDWVMVSWEATENTTSIATVELWLDDENRTVNVTGQNSFNLTSLPEGFHRIHLRAADVLGNSQEEIVQVIVDRSAPTISIAYPGEGDHVNLRSLNATFDIDDLSGAKAIWVKVDDGAWQSNGVNPYREIALSSDGPHNLTVRAEDKVGNIGTSYTRTFHLDTTPPSITAVSPLEGENGVQESSVLLISFSEPMRPTSLIVILRPEGGPTAMTGVIDWTTAGTTVVYDPTSIMPYGTLINVTVSCADQAGNELPSPMSWRFTTVAWVSGSIKDQDGRPISGANVTITGGNGQTYGDETDGSGAFAFEAPTGWYNITVSALDMKDLEGRVEIKVGSVNDLGELGMRSVHDWTWLAVMGTISAGTAILALLLRRKGNSPPSAPRRPKTELPRPFNKK